MFHEDGPFSQSPLTLTPLAGRGDRFGVFRLFLLPVFGEKAPDRADEGQGPARAYLNFAFNPASGKQVGSRPFLACHAPSERRVL